jgi:hypothetical protein
MAGETLNAGDAARQELLVGGEAIPGPVLHVGGSYGWPALGDRAFSVRAPGPSSALGTALLSSVGP